MRDPRTLGPYQPQRLPSILDLIGGEEAPVQAAPAMVEAAAPPPSAASRIAGLVGGAARGVGGLIGSLPPVNILRSLDAGLRAGRDQWGLDLEASQLRNQSARDEHDAALRQAQLEQAQLPAQQAQAAAQARQAAELDQRIQGAAPGRERDSLVRGAATGVFRPFEIEPGPAELAAYQSVLGMQEEEARQRLITQRERQQAQFDATLSRQTTRERLGGELELEREKRKLPAAAPSIDDEKAMRAQFEGLGKEFSVVRQAYKTIRAVDDTKAGDLTFLIQYMKMIDPGATVRESDLATAENAGGVPGSVRAYWNKFKSEEGRIDPKLRADFIAQAENLYQARLGSHRNIEKQYSEIATRRGFDPRNVVTDFVGPDDAPKAPRKTIGGAEYEKVDGGWRLVGK